MGYLYHACDQIFDSCHQQLLKKMRRKMCIYKCMLNVYKNQQNRQTRSRNLMGPKTLPTIWGYLYETCDQISDFCHQQMLRKMRRKMIIYVQCVSKSTKSANKKQESDGSKNASHDMGYLYEACDQISDLYHQQLLRKM